MSLNTAGFVAIQNGIKTSLGELAGSTDYRATGLIAQYNELNRDITSTITTNVDGTTADIISTQQTAFNAQLVELDIYKQTILQSSLSYWTFARVLKEISLWLGMIIAFIVAGNLFPPKPTKDWKYTVLYAFWGMIFYPIPLLYGLYNPPDYHSWLIPIKEEINYTGSVMRPRKQMGGADESQESDAAELQEGGGLISFKRIQIVGKFQSDNSVTKKPLWWFCLTPIFLYTLSYFLEYVQWSA
jgi:hypothetical protein